MARCTLCDKKAVSGSNVSHSQVHTKRKFKPNLQKVSGLLLCTTCLRTIKKVANKEEARIEAMKAVKAKAAEDKESAVEDIVPEAAPAK